MSDIIRVLRLIEYEGPRDLVEEQILKSIQGSRYYTKTKNGEVCITAVTLDGIAPLHEQLYEALDKIIELRLHREKHGKDDGLQQLLEKYGT